MLILWIALFGLILGSFLNVCIVRLPQEKSIVWPGSSCPGCKHAIAFYDNIPILSYFILGGRCRACRAPISPRYPLVEGLTGFSLVVLFLVFEGAWGWMFLAWGLTAALIVATFIDLEHYIIPDEITLPGIALGLLLHGVFPALSEQSGRWLSLLWSAGGLLAGGGSLLLVALVGKAVYKKEVMGLGDVKLMAMVGALLGWQSVLLAIFLGSLAGGLAGMALIATRKSQWSSRIPFGPYLSLGSLIALLIGRDLIGWYVGLFSV